MAFVQTDPCPEKLAFTVRLTRDEHPALCDHIWRLPHGVRSKTIAELLSKAFDLPSDDMSSSDMFKAEPKRTRQHKQPVFSFKTAISAPQPSEKLNLVANGSDTANADQDITASASDVESTVADSLSPGVRALFSQFL